VRRIPPIAIACVLGIATPVLAQNQVALLATVSDRSGQPVPAIDPAAVTVYENGQPIPVLRVEPVERTPKLEVLIDNGAGFPSTNLSDLRNAVKALLNALPDGLEVALLTTAPQPHFLEKGTTSRTRLVSAADRLTFDSHAGKFVDSLYEAAERADKDPLETAVHSLIIIGTTVGDANVLESDIRKTLERIQKKEMLVHVVLFQVLDTNTGGVQLDLGRAAANVAGGRMEVINSATRLFTLLPEIGRSISATTGSGRWIRVIAQRQSSEPMGGMGMSVKGLEVVDLALDRARTK
jgi:hypothetical protein